MSNDIVYDFLYHDAQRVGSILAQTTDSGHLTQVTDKVSKSSQVNVDGKAEAKGKIPLIATGSAGASLGYERGKASAQDRVYDPLWSNAKDFVKYFDEQKQNAPSLISSSIGQIAKLKGRLSVIDFNFLKLFVSNPVIMTSIMGLNQASDESENRKQRRLKKSKIEEDPSNKMVMELFSILPYQVQLYIFGQYDAWATLEEDFLVTKASDLLLKYGKDIDGEWDIIAIVDAMPNKSVELVDSAKLEIGENLEGFGMTVTHMLAPFARNILGRPSNAYGITPLVIYRSVK